MKLVGNSEISRPIPFLLTVIVLSLCESSAFARTFVITDEDCDFMASISETAPLIGWAGISYGPGEHVNSQIDITTRSAFLIQYPLDRIPKTHRITKAELTIPYDLLAPADGIRTGLHRVLADWGSGVCHQFRRTRPERIEWNTPGAMGFGTDRAVKATATAVLRGNGDYTFNVTEDVELWHSGAAGNHGWIITTDDPNGYLRLASPFWGGAKRFKLCITYEPR